MQKDRFLRSQGLKSLATENVVNYYSGAGADYAAWSERLNMHFGYYRWGMNPFRLEPMLEEMTRQVVTRLHLKDGDEAIDLGCGVGTPARQIVEEYPKVNLAGVTIVADQVKKANNLTVESIRSRLRFEQRDYTDTKYPASSFDAAYAIESSCYATGADKADLLAEVFRILKPGARFALADGFLKRSSMNRLLRWCYQKICQCWALGDFAQLDPFTRRMRALGFVDIEVKEISWQIAPSVLHIPFVTLRFFFKELFSREKMTRQRWNNVIAPVLAPFLGLARRTYGYYIICASKSG